MAQKAAMHSAKIAVLVPISLYAIICVRMTAPKAQRPLAPDGIFSIRTKEAERKEKRIVKSAHSASTISWNTATQNERIDSIFDFRSSAYAAYCFCLQISFYWFLSPNEHGTMYGFARAKLNQRTSDGIEQQQQTVQNNRKCTTYCQYCSRLYRTPLRMTIMECWCDIM